MVEIEIDGIAVVGDPYINLALSVLVLAKRDSEKRHGDSNQMWTEFKRYLLKVRNPDPMEVARWVVEFMERKGIRDYCQSVRDRDIARERVKVK